MDKETLYALLAGCALFLLVFYASFRYFSPPGPAAGTAAGSGSSPSARTPGSIPADAGGPTPFVVRPAAPDNASPVSASPARIVPPAPTSYGAAIEGGVRKDVPALQDDEEGPRTTRMRDGGKPVRAEQDRKVTARERRRLRSLPEDD